VNRPVVAVVVCTLLALGAASLWVPLRWQAYAWSTGTRGRDDAGAWRMAAMSEFVEVVPVEHGWPLRWGWNWTTETSATLPLGTRVSSSDASPHLMGHDAVYWHWILVEFALILLLGGGLLTLVVRRERRRKATA
jgi:hypothetical protein